MPPTFAGQPIFGDPTQFTATPFAGTTPLREDDALGLPPGTTPVAPGRAVLITGALPGPDPPTVIAAQQALAAWAGRDAVPMTVPTGITSTGWDTWPSCWFGPGDLAWTDTANPGGIEIYQGGYQAPYTLVVRCHAGPAD